MYDNQPFIILVEPQMAENIGMTARAMMNCGLYNLRLVNPKESHLSDKCLATSANAKEILVNAKVFSSTEDAIADLSFVLATTARHRDQVKPVYSNTFAAKKMNENIANNISCGILFGPERTGLNNKDVSLSNAIINIPLNPKYSSLNLSQAVLLVGYEFYKTQIEMIDEELIINNTKIIEKEKVIKFCEALENEMINCGNFKDSKQRDKMSINIHNIFTRNQMTEQELNSLYGIINHIKK